MRGILAAALLCGGADAAAQVRSSRSLFGGAAGDAAGDRLDLSFSLAEAYDTSALAPDGTPGPATLQVGRYFTGLAGEVRYAKRRNRRELALNATSDLRYFHGVGKVAAVGQSVGVGVALPLGRYTMFTLNEAFAYRPSYLLGLFARTSLPTIGEAVPSGASQALHNRESYSTTTNLGLRRTFGRRGSIDFSSGYQKTMFKGAASVARDVISYHAGGGLGYPMGRNAVLRLGYTYRHAQYAGLARPSQHDIDLGVDYDRPLSRSRRTRLGFSAGSTLIEGPSPSRPATEAVRQFRGVANVLLTHQIGRTWSARAAYRRGAQFVEEFSAPVFTDGVTLTLDGFLNRRTDFAMTAAYSEGEILSARSGAFETYTGNARLRYGLTRHFAGFAEYVYYHYHSSAALPSLANVPPRIGRHTARVGVMLWVPAFRN
jgi:hypothetical protein